MEAPTWIDLLDPSDEQLRDALPDDVHDTVIDRMGGDPRHDDEPRPRLETHGDYLFGIFVVPLFDHDGDCVVFQEIDVVVTRDRMVSVRKTPSSGVPLDLDALRGGALANEGGTGMFLFALVDEVAERFLTLVDDIDDEVDELEDMVEEWTGPQVRERVSDLRHAILQVRRTLTPTRDLARSVLDDRTELDGEELFPREVEIHFADAYDKLLRATDGLDLSRDLLAGVRDYHQAQVANDQNEVMKRLTVVASILLLPTFIVGMYGQNLKGVPEFGWAHGYAWSWGLIIVTTVAQLVYFRRKRWI